MTIPAVAVTGYSGFWNGVGDMQTYAFLTTTQGGNRGRQEKMISKFLSRRQEMLALKELMITLNGATAGAAALESISRVTAQSTSPSVQTGLASMGGDRPVAQVDLVNRVTTAADVAYINQMLQQRFGLAIASYPVDASGNGGGGRVGRI